MCIFILEYSLHCKMNSQLYSNTLAKNTSKIHPSSFSGRIQVRYLYIQV